MVKEIDAATEKRRHPRADARIPVRYRKQGDPADAPVSGTVTGDISAGGLRFRSKELITAACNLILELDLPTLKRPVLATCRVAWVENAGTGRGHEVGSEFMEISRKDQERIAQYVNSFR